MRLAELPKLDTAYPAFFRFRPVADKMLITNQEGEYLLLSDAEFGAFAQGAVDKTSELHSRLSSKNFLREGFDVDRAADKVRGPAPPRSSAPASASSTRARTSTCWS